MKIEPKTNGRILKFFQFAFVSNSSYEFNLECSLRAVANPGCSDRKRRSDEKSSSILIGYKVETISDEIEQFGNIVTVRDAENGMIISTSNVLFLLVLLFFFQD